MKVNSPVLHNGFPFVITDAASVDSGTYPFGLTFDELVKFYYQVSGYSVSVGIAGSDYQATFYPGPTHPPSPAVGIFPDVSFEDPFSVPATFCGVQIYNSTTDSYDLGNLTMDGADETTLLIANPTQTAAPVWATHEPGLPYPGQSLENSGVGFLYNSQTVPESSVFGPAPGDRFNLSIGGTTRLTLKFFGAGVIHNTSDGLYYPSVELTGWFGMGCYFIGYPF